MFNAHVKAKVRINKMLFYTKLAFIPLIIQAVLEIGSEIVLRDINIKDFTYCNVFYFSKNGNKLTWLLYEFCFYLIFTTYILFILWPKNKTHLLDSKKVASVGLAGSFISMGSSRSHSRNSSQDLQPNALENELCENQNILLSDFIS